VHPFEYSPRGYMRTEQLDGMWKDRISDAPDGPVTLDAVEWLGRAALDVYVSTSHAGSVLDG
jgi:hypothetical protein